MRNLLLLLCCVCDYDKQKLNDNTVFVLDLSFEYLNSLSRTADKAYTGILLSNGEDVYQLYYKMMY